MSKTVRAVDGGGAGYRRADVDECGKLSNFATIGQTACTGKLIDFVSWDIPPDSEGTSYALAGINLANKVMRVCPNAHFLDGVALADETTRKTNRPALIFNDMECPTAGVAAMLPDEDLFGFYTQSSGIGIRGWDNGRILMPYGEDGHLHLDISPFAPICGCGVRGCMESILGGNAIRRRVRDETEALGILLPPGEPCRHLDEAYDNGEPWARSIYRMIALGMGILLADLQTTFCFPLIVYKGTFALHVMPKIEDEVRASMRTRLIDPSRANRANLRIIPSPDPVNDALIGAAAMFRARMQECPRDFAGVALANR